MATKKQDVEHGTTKSIQEIQQFTETQQKAAWAKALSEALQLIDLTKNTTKSYTTYNKESLRTYLKNPLSDSNSKNLRKLSQYLYTLSPQYRRIIQYFAQQIDARFYTVIPNVSLTEDNDAEKILQNYEETLKWIEKMNLPNWIYNALITCWREDLYVAYVYFDESSDRDVNSFVPLQLDLDYCKISSLNYDGTISIAFDFSFFDKSDNKIFLDYWDKEFTTGYNAYQKDSNMRWQELDVDRTIVLKANADLLDRVIPPFSGLFSSLIDLNDLQEITAVKDKMSIYKLLVAKIDTIPGSDEVNDFAIDLETAVSFYNKMLSNIPEQIGVVLSPMEITPINFEKSDTDDVNQISKANSNLWEAASVSQLFDNNKLTGSTAVTAAMRFDGLTAMKPLLQQIEARVNRFIDYFVPDNGMRVKYMPITPYFQDEAIKQVKEACSLGLPMKTQYAALMGMSPLDMNSMAYLENEVLQLHDKFIPLESTYTQAGGSDTGGAPEKPENELTDAGSETKDKDKNKM